MPALRKNALDLIQASRLAAPKNAYARNCACRRVCQEPGLKAVDLGGLLCKNVYVSKALKENRGQKQGQAGQHHEIAEKAERKHKLIVKKSVQ
jgi:hypothetical protein